MGANQGDTISSLTRGIVKDSKNMLSKHSWTLSDWNSSEQL